MKLRKLTFLIRATFVTSCIVGLIGCGSGGGGSSNLEGNPVARVEIDASPSQIDAGDRFEVVVVLRDIDKSRSDWLIVKVLHPSGLLYLPDTAYLSGEGFDDIELSVVTSSADESGYVLFAQKTIGFPDEDNIGIFTFEMTGVFEIRSGTIAVDVDTADADIRGSFDPENPQFTTLADTPIRVVDGD